MSSSKSLQSTPPPPLPQNKTPSYTASNPTLTHRSMILSRTRPSLWIPTLMILWGSALALTALVRTPAQLIGMRFLLGATQAGFSPAVIFMISTWYCRHEQSKRFMCYLSAGILSGAFGGVVAGGIVEGLDGAGGVAGWQWCVLIVGELSVGAEVI